MVLASASPRRQLFLQEWGIPYTVVRPTGVEPQPQAGELPAVYALRAARAKAVAVALAGTGEVPPGSLILAADTVVALQKEILGKPADAGDALRMLTLLSGRSHTVISAVSVRLPDGEALEMVDTTQVRFHAWPEGVLAAYVRTGEPADKAGAYAIQGQGAFLVEGISGSWSTVVGLPVTQLAAALLERGILAVSYQE